MSEQPEGHVLNVPADRIRVSANYERGELVSIDVVLNFEQASPEEMQRVEAIIRSMGVMSLGFRDGNGDPVTPHTYWMGNSTITTTS